jgi:hypothetical protein
MRFYVRLPFAAQRRIGHLKLCDNGANKHKKIDKKRTHMEEDLGFFFFFEGFSRGTNAYCKITRSSES